MTKNILIWDGFIRSFHWLLFLCIGGLWYTGSHHLLNWHFLIAFFLLSLIITRLIWGVIGSETAQFRHFIYSPSIVFNYFKKDIGRKKVILGHNPAGGYMVIALLVIIIIQLVTGLFSTDDIFTDGPLMHLISHDLSLLITKAHQINFNILLSFIAVHICSVIIYQFKRHNLLMPMMTGNQQIESTDGQNTPRMKNGLIALLIFCVIANIIYFLFVKELLAYWL